MLRTIEGGVTLTVRAQPGARKTRILGVYGEGATAQLKVAVQSPPVDGRANAALIEFLSELFRVPRASVELLSGEHSRSKVLLVRGISAEQARSRLNAQ